jgi:hypothetical protein
MHESWVKARVGEIKVGDTLRATVTRGSTIHVVDGTVLAMQGAHAQVEVTAITSMPPDADPPTKIGARPMLYVPECDVLVTTPEPRTVQTLDPEAVQHRSEWQQRMAHSLQHQISQARREGRVLDVFSMEIELGNYIQRH